MKKISWLKIILAPLLISSLFGTGFAVWNFTKDSEETIIDNTIESTTYFSDRIYYRTNIHLSGETKDVKKLPFRTTKTFPETLEVNDTIYSRGYTYLFDFQCNSDSGTQTIFSDMINDPNGIGGNQGRSEKEICNQGILISYSANRLSVSLNHYHALRFPFSIDDPNFGSQSFHFSGSKIRLAVVANVNSAGTGFSVTAYCYCYKAPESTAYQTGLIKGYHNNDGDWRDNIHEKITEYPSTEQNISNVNWFYNDDDWMPTSKTGKMPEVDIPTAELGGDHYDYRYKYKNNNSPSRAFNGDIYSASFYIRAFSQEEAINFVSNGQLTNQPLVLVK